MRPAGTEGWSEERLAALVTRDSMIGTGLPRRPDERGLMDGVHDMGGMDGFGKVEPEPNEPVFHEPWEGRVMAMNRAHGRGGRVEHRHGALLRAKPCRLGVYLSSSYYERWQLAMEQLLAERGLVDRRRARRRPRVASGKPLPGGRFTTADVARVHDARLVRTPGDRAARFAPGDRVRARNIHPRTHTRLPRYVRGRLGHCRAHPGAATCFPTRLALGHDEARMALHGLLRGPRAVGRRMPIRRSRISVEAFEPYLEPA